MPDPNTTLIADRMVYSEEALQQMARTIREKGSVPILSAIGGETSMKITDARVTKRGVEVIIAPVPNVTEHAARPRTRYATLSMGTLVEPPPSCSVCDAGHKRTKAKPRE